MSYMAKGERITLVSIMILCAFVFVLGIFIW